MALSAKLFTVGGISEHYDKGSTKAAIVTRPDANSTVNYLEEPAASIWRQLSRSAGVPLYYFSRHPVLNVLGKLPSVHKWDNKSKKVSIMYIIEYL